MEYVGWILSVLLIPASIALFPFIRKVYFAGPQLTIEIILSSGGGSEPLGLSVKNDISKGYIEGNEAIYCFKVTWKFKIIITNNSMVTAYYPQIIFLKDQVSFKLIDKLNEYTPINENEKVTLNGEFTIFEECKGVERTHIKGLPPHFTNLTFLLEYKNQHKKTFYTKFTYNEQGKFKNDFRRLKPKEI
jgi:hypothetical protein